MLQKAIKTFRSCQWLHRARDVLAC
jgi:hypothetical protein